MLAEPARRIVSLAPHITELLFAAGAGDYVIGAVEYSDYPAKAKEIPIIGAYDRMDIEAVLQLSPDLIVAWDSGNNPEQVNRLEAFGIPVFRSEPRNLETIPTNLRAFGFLAQTQDIARSEADDFDRKLGRLRQAHSNQEKVGVFYQIWDEPLFTIGGEHIITDVIELCGGRNVFDDLPGLAPRIDVEAVVEVNPQLIVTSSPEESSQDWLTGWRSWPGLEAVKTDQLHHISPDLLQRHSPRLLSGAAQMCSMVAEVRTKADINRVDTVQ